MTEKLRVYVCAVAALGTGILPVGCDRSPQAKEAQYLRRGAAPAAQKDYDRAALGFRNTLKGVPKRAEAHHQHGLAYPASGNVVNVLATLHHPPRIYPK